MFKFCSYLKTLQSPFQNPKFHSEIHNHAFRNPKLDNPAIQCVLDEVEQARSSRCQLNEDGSSSQNGKSHISHPWREWVNLMENILKRGYFDGIGNPFLNNGELGNKEANFIRTACLNFARDHYQLIRYLSVKDIKVIVGSGCPSTDRKVVNSGKRLRAHVGINEGNVCSSCILRGDCDRAYVKAREDEGGRTVDVMRILLTYGLDPIIGSVENKPCLNRSVKESVRTLLNEMVQTEIETDDHEPSRNSISEFSSSVKDDEIDRPSNQRNFPVKQGEWICPKCDFHNFARNMKCLRCDTLFEERVKKLSEELEHLPLKKGDWICDKCNFLNFARNTRCLQCKEKPPKRNLNPGEWECDSCNYINFRRNMVCLKCDHKRPIAFKAADTASQTVNNNMKDHQTHTWFGQKNQSRYEVDDSLEFVKSPSHDRISSRSRRNGIMDFPVVGGKSKLSQNVEQREKWKMEMANRSKRDDRGKVDNGRYEHPLKFYGESEYSASDCDDEMTEWFRGRKKS